MTKVYTRPVCRGSWALGTACSKCQRCEDTRVWKRVENIFDLQRDTDMTQEDASSFHQLTFQDLRRANIRRLPQFKNHRANPDGSDWSLNDWFTAVVGEFGELGNLLKKVRRGDFTLNEAREDIGKEIADVQIYLDILAFQVGVDLSEATVRKFNEVSDHICANVRL